MSHRHRPQTDPDDAIRATDDDAAASRLSAAALGYIHDSYTSILYKPSAAVGGTGPSTSRKPPLINVGTHHRTYAIDRILDSFLDSVGPGGGQVVSLGAGSDSRFWRCHEDEHRWKRIKRYVEVDFPHVTSTKAQRIARSPKLSAGLASPTSTKTDNDSTGRTMSPPASTKPYQVHKGGTSLVSSVYALLPLDLRTTPSSTLQEELLPYLDRALPTLFLAECVFCYMKPKQSEEIIRWFGSTFPDCIGVIYEMCGLSDTFGQVMKRNLAARNLSLPGAEPFPDVQSQADRFLAPSLGEGCFDTSGAKSLWDVRQTVVGEEELARISRLEMLDEVEELKLVLEHYCVAWGIKGDRLRAPL